jgi:XTP/dITP diphosphohydrolase
VGRLKARLASKNGNKARELSRALPGWEIELLGADEFPPEEGETYLENALGKARFGRGRAEGDVWILGEDSGIEVEALGSRPGVESARWAADVVTEILRALGGNDERRARYVCEAVAVSPEGNEFRATGTLEGTVATEPRGDEGFGYDPIFVPDGEERTVAELGNEWKSQGSHRARAARELLAAIGGRAG